MGTYGRNRESAVQKGENAGKLECAQSTSQRDSYNAAQTASLYNDSTEECSCQIIFCSQAQENP